MEKAKAHLAALYANVEDASKSATTETPKPGMVPDAVSRSDRAEKFKPETKAEICDEEEEERRVSLSFSSELPVSRGEYMEVLSHDPNDVDLSRLNDAHPLLLNHDPDR